MDHFESQRMKVYFYQLLVEAYTEVFSANIRAKEAVPGDKEVKGGCVDGPVVLFFYEAGFEGDELTVLEGGCFEFLDG